jgi:hypothetical protein
VRVEKPAGDIVGITVCITVFMVDAMITTPVVDGSLVGGTGEEEEEESEGSPGLERMVGP